MSEENTVQMMAEAQIREPKSPFGAYTLPCGYLDAKGALHTEVVLREINGKDEDMIASKQIPDQKKMSQLLVSCITRLGSIVDRGQIAAAVPELLIGDRIFLILAIRRTSLGDSYPYVDTCPECDTKSLMTVDLSEVEISPMPEPLKRIYDVRLPTTTACREWANTGELPEDERTAPSGHAVRFRPLNGRDEAEMGRIFDKEDAATKVLQKRVELLDEAPASVAALQVLTMAERSFLREEIFEKADGGVETTLDVECPNCSHEYKRELEVTSLGFFFPSRLRKSWKTKSST